RDPRSLIATPSGGRAPTPRSTGRKLVPARKTFTLRSASGQHRRERPAPIPRLQRKSIGGIKAELTEPPFSQYLTAGSCYIGSPVSIPRNSLYNLAGSVVPTVVTL